MVEEQRRALQAIEADYAPGSATVTEIEDELQHAIDSADRECKILSAMRVEIRAREATRQRTADSYRQRLRGDREGVLLELSALEAEESRLRGQSLDEYLRSVIPRSNSPPTRSRGANALVAQVARDISDVVTRSSAAMIESAEALANIPRSTSEARSSQHHDPW